MKKILFLFLLAVSAGCTKQSQAPLTEAPLCLERRSNYIDLRFTNTTKTTVTYTTGLSMDIYQPVGDNGTGRAWVLCVSPSGDFTNGNAPAAKWARDEFALRGYVGVVVNSGQNDPMTPTKSLAGAALLNTAARYMRDHASTYHIDTSKQFEMGVSLGGIIALLASIGTDNTGDPHFDDSHNSENADHLAKPLATATISSAATSTTLSYLQTTTSPNYAYQGLIDCTVYYSIAEACATCGNCSANSGALETYVAMDAIGITSTLVTYANQAHSINLTKHQQIEDDLIPKFAALAQ